MTPMFIDSSFKAAWWLNNAHLQTIYPTFFRKINALSIITRERLNTPDHDFIDIDWCGTDRSKPLVLLLHGLSGSADSVYIQGLQIAFANLGWRTVAMNYRGCSGEYNVTARCYHSGDTEDLHFLYTLIRQREPETPLAAVGFSLGGNILLKWLGEQGSALSLFAAVAVSVPLLLNRCATRLDSGLSKLYCRRLLTELKSYVLEKKAHLLHLNKPEEAEKLAVLGDLNGIDSFWQYDDQVIAKLYGFQDVHDYYQRASSRQFLKHIHVPTLLIQAVDDPFMFSDVLPDAEELSPAVKLEVTQGGGHVGFISGDSPLKAEYWLDQRIPDYLVGEYKQQTKAALS